MNGKLSFDPKKILNKTLLFDTIIMDMIIRALAANNDDFYIERLVGSNSFTLKTEDGS